jgi:hypothetical protein
MRALQVVDILPLSQISDPTYFFTYESDLNSLEKQNFPLVITFKTTKRDTKFAKLSVFNITKFVKKKSLYIYINKRKIYLKLSQGQER